MNKKQNLIDAGATFLAGLVLIVVFALIYPKNTEDVVEQSEDGKVAELEEAPLSSTTRIPKPSYPNQDGYSRNSEEKEALLQQYVVKKNDTMSEILEKIGADAAAKKFLLSKKFSSYRKLKPKKIIRYQINDEGQLISLHYKTSADMYLSFSRDEFGIMSANENPPKTTSQLRRGSGYIESSLFAATGKANIPDQAVLEMANALESLVDFYRDIRKGDEFKIIYEVMMDEDGDLISADRVKGFSFTTQGKEIIGLYNPDEQGYYTDKGVSLRRAFLRSPIKFSRISSRFSLRRFHPVLKKWRAHRGVDYAAPRGTPIRATGNGTISFVGKKGGYGNVIFINHQNGQYTTVYGHMNKFAKGIRKNSKVEQGQVIGYVGSTGLATGPHLHYEFRVRGEHRDPLSTSVPVQLPPLEGSKLTSFLKQAQSVIDELATLPNTTITRQ